MTPRVASVRALAIAALAALAPAEGGAKPGADLAITRRGSALELRGAARTPFLPLGGLAIGATSEAVLPSVRSGRWRSGALLERRGARWDGWLEVAVERRLRPGVEAPAATPFLEAGLGGALGGATIAARVRHRTVLVPREPRLVLVWTSPPRFRSPPDVIPEVPYWERPAARAASATALEAVLGWARGRWDVEAGAGLMAGRELHPVRSARLTAMRWLHPRLALRLEATGAAPERLIEDPGEQSGVHLGLRWAIAGEPRAAGVGRGVPRWSVAPARGGAVAIRARAPGARRVALRGDPTAWEPLALERVGPGVWETLLAVGPGVHRIEVSIDGGPWRAPEGLPASPGAFGTPAGTFVVR